MSDEAWAEFRHDTKLQLDELFNRMRRVELVDAVKDERDKSLIEKFDKLAVSFETHSDAEMIKYKEITDSQDYLKTFLHYFIGGSAVIVTVFTILNFIGIERLSRLF